MGLAAVRGVCRLTTDALAAVGSEGISGHILIRRRQRLRSTCSGRGSRRGEAADWGTEEAGVLQ